MSICTVPSCGLPVSARGWCQRHYNRWYRHGDVRADEPFAAYTRQGEECIAAGCDRPPLARDLCTGHYSRWAEGKPVDGAPLRETLPYKSAADCHPTEPNRGLGMCSSCYHRYHDFGVSPDELNQMYAQQDGRCAVCRDPIELRGRGCHVDHDHETGAVRGLLCGPCNRGIGYLKDSHEVIEAAAQYLRCRRGD